MDYKRHSKLATPKPLITIGLSQIVKNEAHCIEKMLDSVLTIIDHVAIVDTGSTDGTQDLIRKWCEKHRISCDIMDRPFDDFAGSRNAAMALLGTKTTYGIWLDADETLSVDKSFDKQGLDMDIYMVQTYIGTMRYTRNELFRTGKPFYWYGPVHEFIMHTDKTVTAGVVQGLSVNVTKTGASWKGELHEKYKKHSQVLENYVRNDKDPRWLFYLAQSYNDSAAVPNDRSENDERLRRAKYYYTLRAQRPGGFHEERVHAQLMVGKTSVRLEEPWSKSSQELLKAYQLDPGRAEAIKAIIDHYVTVQDFNMAYLYTKFAVSEFKTVPDRKHNLDESLYVWKLLDAHALSCHFTGRSAEAKQTYLLINEALVRRPDLFTDTEKTKIQQNSTKI